MRITLPALFFTCMLTLGGCATPAREYEGADFGTVVVSVESEENSINPWLFFHLHGSRDATPVTVDTAQPTLGKFQIDSTVGIVRAIKLKPGTYEIDAFQYNYNGTTIGSRTPPFDAIRFMIAPGQVTYAGSYAMGLTIARPDQVKTTGIVAVVPDTAMEFTIRPQDRRVRDLGIAATVHPQLDVDQVRQEKMPVRDAMVFRVQ